MQERAGFLQVDFFLLDQALVKHPDTLDKTSVVFRVDVAFREMNRLHQILFPFEVRMHVLHESLEGIFQNSYIAQLNGNFIFVDQDKQVFVIVIDEIVANGQAVSPLNGHLGTECYGYGRTAAIFDGFAGRVIDCRQFGIN